MVTLRQRINTAEGPWEKCLQPDREIGYKVAEDGVTSSKHNG